MDTLGDPFMGRQTPREKQAPMLRGIAFANSKASCQPSTAASPPLCHRCTHSSLSCMGKTCTHVPLYPGCSSPVPPAALSLRDFSGHMDKSTQVHELRILVFSSTQLVIPIFFQVKKRTSLFLCQISHLPFSFSSRAPAFLFLQAFFSEPCVLQTTSVLKLHSFHILASSESWCHQPAAQRCSRD